MGDLEIGRFVGRWVANFLKRLQEPFNWFGGVVGILSWVGLFQFSDLNLYGSSAVFVLFIIYLLWKSFPDAYLRVSSLTNRRLELADLDRILTPFKTVAILGNSSVGKSTFLSAASNRDIPDGATEAPYAVVVPIPDTRPTQFVGFIDTVGREYPNQVQMIERADALLIFLDHNSSGDDVALESVRMKEHERSTEGNIVPAIRQSSGEYDGVLIVANKADLWGSAPEAVEKMNALAVGAKDKILATGEFATPSKVSVIPSHSNLKSQDVSTVIKMFRAP
ncbi:MAG: GTPase [Caulobacter sp.]|nr:GTPase [Caulobacter sp.]